MSGLVVAGLLLGLIAGPVRVDGAAPAFAFADLYGPRVTLVADRDPGPFRGDFNGDGHTDALFVVRVTGPLENSDERLTITMPWNGPGAQESVPAGKWTALALVHLDAHGKPLKGYLCYDAAEISILDASAATPRVIARSVAELPNTASHAAMGEVIVIPTEAGIDTYLYWDDGDYRFHEPEELP